MNMPLCEQPAGQSMENPTPPPSHRELGLGSPLKDLGKYRTAKSLSKIMLSEH